MTTIGEVSKNLKSTIRILKIQDRDFADALEKWEDFFCNLACKGAFTTQVDAEDFSQDLLSAASLANSSYKLDLYRFKGNLYEIVRDGEEYCTIRSLRYNKKFKRAFVTTKDKLEKVKKGKLSSVIYTAIYQEYIDQLNKFFRRKNGFDKVGTKKELVKIRSGNVTSYEVKEVDIMERSVDFLSFDSESENGYCLEDFISDKSIRSTDAMHDIQVIHDSLPDEAQAVLRALVIDPSLNLRTLSTCLDKPARALEGHYEELIRVLSILKKSNRDPFEKTPIRIGK